MAVSSAYGCKCQGCGNQFRVDVQVPEQLWSSIKPPASAPGAGLLCGVCVINAIEAKGQFAAFKLEPV